MANGVWWGYKIDSPAPQRPGGKNDISSSPLFKPHGFSDASLLRARERDGEDDVARRLDVYRLGLRQHVVASTHLPAKVRLPVRDIPLEALGREPARPADWQDADVLAKDIAPSVPDLDVVLPLLQEECQALAREQKDTSVLISGALLEEVEVVDLAQSLVDAAAQATEGDDVCGVAVFRPRPVYGLGEVRRVLGCFQYNLDRFRD